MKTANITTNSAAMTDNISAIIGASNDRPLAGGEWEQITPWGEFPNAQGVQRIGPAQGSDIVSAFNAQAAKEESLFRGLPIYVGHPDVDPKIYTDHRRYGKLEALRVSGNGLDGRIAWNDLGQKNQTEGYFVFPSPVWYFKRVGGGIIEPTCLVSVGLTNSPNIPGSSPWARNDTLSDTAAENPRAMCEIASRKIQKLIGEAYPADLVLSGVVASRAPTETWQEAADRFVANIAASRGLAKSTSSGPGNHVHIHFHGATDADKALNDAPKRNIVAEKVRAHLTKKRAPLIAAIGAAKERQAGLQGASQVAIEAHRLMASGESQDVAWAKARATFPGAAAAHADLIKTNAMEALTRDLMDKDKTLSYQAAWRRAKTELKTRQKQKPTNQPS